MDQTFLEQFRQQIATWIEARLDERRLPFQRVELCPRVVTERGALVPDMVLWINRDSQLAGSVILLPDAIDEQTCSEGCALAKALGLGHFTLWSAKEVSIWEGTESPVMVKSLNLPESKRISPADFQQTLDKLLEQLKITAVTSAPATSDFNAYYFANLCLRNLQELAPGLEESARVTAGQTAADIWVKHAPLEKAWLSLWRLLFLLQHKRLPPGLQPERLESTISYALADFGPELSPWLEMHEAEPPLPEGDAIRLHHLASRLRQLDWPHDDAHAHQLIELLLNEAAKQFCVTTPNLPWPTEKTQLWINCRPATQASACSIVAPRPYLAGCDLGANKEFRREGHHQAETLQDMQISPAQAKVVARLDNERTLLRAELDYHLMALRKTWPNRRFDLPRGTPAWLMDALHLIGSAPDRLSLILPRRWPKAPGIDLLWSKLNKQYQLLEVAYAGPEHQAFSLATHKSSAAAEQRIFYRTDGRREVPANLLQQLFPGLIQLWLCAEAELLPLLENQQLTCGEIKLSELNHKLSWGIFLFCQTTLGRYLRRFYSPGADTESIEALTTAVVTNGLPLPSETSLYDLSLLGCSEDRLVPATTTLDRELKSILGAVPKLPQEPEREEVTKQTSRRRSGIFAEQLTERIFIDGVPNFPEHYLMSYYRPELQQYEFSGPLQISEMFFDQVLLQSIKKETTLEVTGKTTAAAIILASHTGATKVELPLDDSITEAITRSYRKDLTRLWDELVRECRRIEPRRQVAIKLARRTWLQHKLPPEEIFRAET